MTDKDAGAKAKPKTAAAPEEFARTDPTEAVAPEGMEDAPSVRIGGIEVDLDDLELPKEISKAAFKSGRYPYDDKLDSKEGDKALVSLQIELLKLQAWAKKQGERIVIVFEGRDAAGKGGTIDRITQHLNPRSVRLEALSKPTAEEASEWYFQRYLRRMPSGGEIVIFDRSWYNRAGVEPVMGFSTPAQTAKFLADAPVVERLLVEDGVRLLKFWLTVGREEQISRLHERRHDPLKRWKLSPIDYAGLNLWSAYSDAADKMLRATHTDAAPWMVVKSNDKRRLRLAVIRHILLTIPYQGRDLAAIGGNDSRLIMDAAAFLAKGGEE